MMFGNIDTHIPVVGEAKIPTPIQGWKNDHEKSHFVSDEDRVLVDVTPGGLEALCRENKPFPSFEMAGPRQHVRPAGLYSQLRP